jgi:dTDP-4-dehydrorhamnose 3,5-epimerase
MGKFNFIPTGIEGLTIVEPTVFGDRRGYFMETYHKSLPGGRTSDVVCAGQPVASRRGVLRGLHFQKQNPQGKLVRVISGRVFDVAGGPAPAKSHPGPVAGRGTQRREQAAIYIPEGFAHGFLVLSETAEFVYKCTASTIRRRVGGLLWNDRTSASVGLWGKWK